LKLKSPYLSTILKKKMVVVTVLGFSSGLPLPLSSGTLQAYLSVSGVDLEIIGIFTLAGLPYTLKFLWAPLLDRFSIPLLSRRRGWILLTQVVLFFLILSFSFFNPKEEIGIIGIISFFLAFFSASQDIVVDAFRTDSLKASELGIGASIFVMGYRIAMLVSGAIALIMADRLGWKSTYLFLAFLMLLSIAGTLAGDEEPISIKRKDGFKEWVLVPVSELIKKEKFLLILMFVILYKLGDAYLGAMTVPFLIKGVGFTPTEVGTMNKLIGLLCTIAGAFLGGIIMVRLSLYDALFYFGCLQMVSNLAFIFLSLYGKSYLLLVLCVIFENVSGGMGTSAFMAYLMSLCTKKYSATQFAILSSLSAFGRILISPTSGFVASYFGWTPFFIISSLLAVPGIAIILKIKRHFQEGEANRPLLR
jgi:PAT family beta-lactamase induction signal transducer AmpG